MNKYDGLNAISKPLSRLPTYLSERVLEQIRSLTDYEPVIGIMGKTGVGKSSLCNALFQADISPVSDVTACTRDALRFRLQIGERSMTIIDLPGVGESALRDREYASLYRGWLPQVDIVLWLLKADDRALAIDETFYRDVIGEQYRQKILFVVNQTDKLEPCHEWDTQLRHPSEQQQTNLNHKLQDIRQLLLPIHPICAVSVKESWGLTRLVETLMDCLPREATSPLLRQLRNLYRNERVKEHAKTDFSHSVGGAMDSVIDLPFLPTALKSILIKAKETVIAIARSVWHFLF